MAFFSDKAIRELLGQKGDSWLHRMDPRVKITWFLLMFITGFMVMSNVIGLALLFIYVLILGWTAGVFHKQLAMLKIIIPLLVMVVFFNLLLLPLVKSVDQRVLVEFPFKYPWYYLAPSWFSPTPMTVTATSLYMSAARGLVILALSGVASLFFLIIEITELIEGLTLMRIPYKLAFICGLTVNYIPILFNDLNTIAEAQKARGHRLDQGKGLARIKASLALLLPAINCAYIRAGNISDSMNARAFGAQAKRTTLVERYFKTADYYFLALNIAILIGGILAIVLGGSGLIVRY